MIIQAGNAVAAWIYLWMTFQLGFYESTDLLPRVSGCLLWPGHLGGRLRWMSCCCCARVLGMVCKF